jgi:pimeloyl-ACP methyl ester carboxylesterase
MAIKPRLVSSLPTSFGVSWGRAVTLAGAAGGRLFRPDGFMADEKLGVIVYLPGYGQDHIAGVSKLALTTYRAANRGMRYLVLALQGTFTFGGTNRTWNANDALLPQNSSYPWTANTAVVLGHRRTNGGNMYFCVGAGTTAASGGPTSTAAFIIDGSAQWRCVVAGAIGDVAIPDLDWVAGPGRTVSGVVRPKGVLTELLESGYNIDRSRIIAMGYSTGGAMAEALARHYPQIFTHVIVSSGCGMNGLGDHNYAAASAAAVCNLLSFHGSADVTVNPNGVPPGPSSAAVGNHPSTVLTVENYASSAGVPVTLANTGVTADMTSVAGSETQIWAPVSDPVDANGNTIRFRMHYAVGEGHNFAPNNTKAWFETNFAETNPRSL